MNKPSNAFNKTLVLIRQLTNWPVVVKDKLIGGDNVVYKFRNGEVIECRTKSSDINEAVVVLSGIEYPERFCTLSGIKQPIIVDIGANIGTFSLYAHRLNKQLKPIIYAFEPHPDNIKLTEVNFKRNDLLNYHLIQKAVSGSDGNAQFDISGAFDSFKLSAKADKTIEVQTVKLSTFCATQNIKRIDLLKMDIEGGEYDVIEHDISFIKDKVATLLVEYHNIDIEDGQSVLRKALEADFTIHIQNPHKDGGMLIAVNKKLLKMLTYNQDQSLFINYL